MVAGGMVDGDDVPPSGPTSPPDPDAGAVAKVRRKAPWLDHVIRAYGRYSGDGGSSLAASITYFAFLSFFPLIALAAGVLTIVTNGNGSAAQTVVDQVNSFSPGLADSLKLKDLLTNPAVASSATGIGLAGLLYSGLGWVSALRKAIRSMWHQNIQIGNFITAKLRDLLLLVGLAVMLALSVVISAVTGSAADFLLGLVDQQGSVIGRALLFTLGPLLSLLTDVLLFGFVFIRLSRVKVGWEHIGKAALLAAVAFEVLKRVGGVYISHTTGNPIYGIFAVVIGLLVWIHLISEMLMFCAAWAATAPFDSDVPPSGTSSPQAADQAGLPRTFTSADPDHPPMLRVHGSPSPLRLAIRGKADAEMAPAGWRPEPAEPQATTGPTATSTQQVRDRIDEVNRRHDEHVREAQARAERVTAGVSAVAVGTIALGLVRTALRARRG